MANKLVAHMGLPQSIANLFAARNIQTAKDALSLPEFDLMTLLGVDIKDVRDAVARICEALSLLEEQLMVDTSRGHLNTLLTGLDAALGGGIPFGVLTELVGPSGIGKTQTNIPQSTLLVCTGTPLSSEIFDFSGLALKEASTSKPKRLIYAVR
ncbi:DNA repair protein RAD51 homolog 2-like [Phalaenopsis equestris]|uniref:DNA repair protein RAD51 homolog 2-like n=1 Tax=Phalaenopsis equestris TaxID=78828 RepID=UPI0009E4E0D8|nr:DNA repair protein RAD51 homolog 2-like [Phalaenopsis equestris]